jgi:hypothetical protein
VTYVGADGQVNLRVSLTAVGPHDLTVGCGGVVSSAAPVEFVP